jgi:DNA-binding NtrC family response regulator
MKARVLVVDDHEELVELLVESLRAEGYAAEGESDPRRALERALAEAWDVVLSDVEMPGLRGLELLRELLAVRPEQLVLLMTAFGSVPMAVQAVRAGAADFITKPFPIEELLRALERALHTRALGEEIVRLRRGAEAASHDGLIARSPAMQRVVELAARAARTDSRVLITGESGVGKGVLARFIHARSGRANGPFVQVNCASIPAALAESELFGVRRGAFTDAREDREGLFARAHRGTLFLDEVGELPLEVQPKLLVALETGRFRPLGAQEEQAVDVRVLAASNRALEQDVRERRFRPDLYFRLRVIEAHIPPLRERPDDIEPLVDALLAGLRTTNRRPVLGIEAAALQWLKAQEWPGNVRELANALERAVALGESDVVTLRDLEGNAAAPQGWATLEDALAVGLPLAELELAYITRTVQAHGGNLSQAARALGIDRRTLARRLGEER